MKKLLSNHLAAQSFTGLYLIIAMSIGGISTTMAQNQPFKDARPIERSQPAQPQNNPQRTPPPVQNNERPAPVQKRPAPSDTPSANRAPGTLMPKREIPARNAPVPPSDEPKDKTAPPGSLMPKREIPMPPKPPRHHRPPQVIVIDNPTTIVETQTVVETQTLVREVEAVPQLSYPRAAVFIKYKTISRSTVVATALQPKGMQPVAMETQTFSPGPIVRWECNPVMPGRDVYEFWIGYGNGNLQKVDIVYYGDSITVWDDGDLVIIVG